MKPALEFTTYRDRVMWFVGCIPAALSPETGIGHSNMVIQPSKETCSFHRNGINIHQTSPGNAFVLLWDLSTLWPVIHDRK
jgi:hypothetical protein